MTDVTIVSLRMTHVTIVSLRMIHVTVSLTAQQPRWAEASSVRFFRPSKLGRTPLDESAGCHSGE